MDKPRNNVPWVICRPDQTDAMFVCACVVHRACAQDQITTAGQGRAGTRSNSISNDELGRTMELRPCSSDLASFLAFSCTSVVF